MKQPFTLDGINYDLTGCCVYFLTIDDTIRSDDFVRGVIETGSEGGFDTTYKKDEWRGLRWHQVEEDLHGWIGNTYRDLLTFTNTETMRHEIVRVVPANIQFELELQGKMPQPGEHIAPPKQF